MGKGAELGTYVTISPGGFDEVAVDSFGNEILIRVDHDGRGAGRAMQG